MEDGKIGSPEEQAAQPEKPSWQRTKENWYDKLNVTVKQMDMVVGICWALIALTAVAIGLEAAGIWSLFG